MVKIFIIVIIIIASMKIEKVIIIGGGPAGLAAAIYNARADLQPLVIAGSPPGGQLTLTNAVENYPGFESILGQELIQKMRSQAEKLGARFINQNVTKVDFSRKPLTLYIPDRIYKSDTVLIATGAEARWLNLESERRLRGKGVSACAICDGFFFRNKVVGVVGGGDSAMEEALTLTKFADKVYIIHRRSHFRSCKLLQKRVLESPKIEIIWNAVVEEVLGNNRVSGVKLTIEKSTLNQNKLGTGSSRSAFRSGVGSETQIIKLDGLFVAIGHKPAIDFLKGSGIGFDKREYIITSKSCAINKFRNLDYKSQIFNYNLNYQYMTSISGVFAAGDVIDPIYRQVATAVGTGVEAALELERYLLSQASL
jgi:thioredoxin reductase (NADPH)